MKSFSDRYNLKPILQCNEVSPKLRKRLLLVIYKYEVCTTSDPIRNSVIFEISPVEELLEYLGAEYNIGGPFYRLNNYRHLERIVKQEDWYVVFDVIERYLDLIDKRKVSSAIREMNLILQEEQSQWMIVDNKVVPKFINEELADIETAMNSLLGVSNIHIEKALRLLSLKEAPDYANSIKESISAVEAACKFITGLEDATLGKAIKHMCDVGVEIHQSLRQAFEKLYGYTSDESGIRHAGIDFTNAGFDEARFMFVTCSAFVNYLSEKYKLISSK